MSESYTQSFWGTNFLEEGPLVSIVIPAYNTEKYLKQCLDSILTQIYKNLEVIVVDCASTDGTAEIISEYRSRDERVKSVTWERDQGVFQSRVSGMEVAKGKYFAFIDSDDYVSVDWIHKFVQAAEKDQADMVVGEWCYDTGSKKEYCTLDPFRINNYDLTGPEVLVAFMAQAGRHFSWSVVWNKLYSRELWDRCFQSFKDFSERHGHMRMWEDVVFSSGFWSHAKKVVNVHFSNYFYVRHEAAATLAIKHDTDHALKYIADASSALAFMKDILQETGRWEEVKNFYEQWEKRWVSIVYQDLVVGIGTKKYEKRIRSAFAYEGEFENTNYFFSHLTTELHPSFFWYEDIKREIASPTTRYVSFDIFDTLIQRPFYYPTDLFAFLSDEVNRHTSSYVDFVQIRKDAEKNCREKLRLYHPSQEDITLDDIYLYIDRNYSFDQNLLSRVKEKELQLELRFCTARKTGKELYELALEAGKVPIICSDMYLPEKTVRAILEKNGYTGYKKLYLSSTLKLTKHYGSIYKFILKDLDVKTPNQIVHIGDNWDTDVVEAKRYGIRAQHLAKATIMLENGYSSIYSGGAFSELFQKNYDHHIDMKSAFCEFPALRNVWGMIANHNFDNPFVSIHPNSDFNANPENIGYFALGPYLLAITDWISQIAGEKNIPTIHFVARDGYYIKKAFDIVNQTSTRSQYLHVSRTSLLLADIECKEDVYSIFWKLNVWEHSPKDFAEYFGPLISEAVSNRIPEIVNSHDLYYDRKLKNTVEYERCIKVFLDEILDFSMLPPYREKLRQYFSKMIEPGDYIFDIGYKGRTEAALSNILGYPVGSLYIHTNSETAKKRQNKYHCPAYCFYDYKPQITDIMRECFFMEKGPSTIGYEEHDGQLEPKFEEYKPQYESDFVCDILQKSALAFIKNYFSTFGEFHSDLVLQKNILAMPFEYYLHDSKEFDREIFQMTNFEDKLGMGAQKTSFLQFWNREIQNRVGHSSQYPQYINSAVLPGLYAEGQFVKFYQLTNVLFPRGSTRREIVKKITRIFIR